MKFLRQQILEFTSINIPATYPDWDETESYIRETDENNLTLNSVALMDNFYYRSVSEPNLGNNPLETLGIHWTKHKVSNRYAMIDLRSQTSTVSVGNSIVVEFIRGDIDTLGLGNFGASKVIVEYIDELDVVESQYTQEYIFGENEGVENFVDLVDTPYSDRVDRGVYMQIYNTGYKIRVTFEVVASTNKTTVGYMIGGKAYDMGETLSDVNFSFQSFSIDEDDVFGTTTTVKRNARDLTSFETLVKQEKQNRMKKEAKKVYGEIVLFIVDPSENSLHENMLTLGKIENASTSTSVFVKERMSWEIKENI